MQQQFLPPEEIAITPSVQQGSGVSGEHSTPLAAQSADAEVVSQLLPLFVAETQRYRKRVRSAIRLAVAGGILVTVVNAIAILVAAQLETEFPLGVTFTMLLLYVLLLLSGVVLPLRSGARRNSLRERLVRHNDVRVVGPLTDLLASSDLQMRRTAADMLTKLLPRITADDARLLDAEQRQRLGDVLRNAAREDTDLSVAILRAFAQVGDSSVLSVVERIADSPALTRRRRRLKAEALECLPLLQAHVRYEQASRTLLRASGPASSAPDTLLRPTAPTATTRPDQLLRPVEGEDR